MGEEEPNHNDCDQRKDTSDLFPEIQLQRVYVSIEVSTKDMSFNSYPLSHGHVDQVSFSLSHSHQVMQGPPHKELESLASLYNQREWWVSKNENSSQDNKNSQLSNVQAYKSPKLKAIKCGVEMALEA